MTVPGEFLFVRFGIVIRFVVLIICAWRPVVASQRWICVTTPHFEMYTTSSEKQAVRTLQVLEQVRYFFLQRSVSKQAPSSRVRIIAFSSEKDYKPYRPNAGTFAYYLQSRERDYIVMQDIEPDHHQAAMHEYTHLIVQHTKMQLPVWLNEGMAELYSSLEPHGQGAMVGRPSAARAGTLAKQKWMDWNVLLAVDHDSPFYNESEKMSIFYAQSWALTHMLFLSPAYSSGFSQFLLTVANGSPTPEALRKVYGKTVPEVGRDVVEYVRQSSMEAAVYEISLSKSDLDEQTTNLSDFQVSLALADLLASRKETASEAQRQMLVLEQQNPGNSDLEVSLGYLAWQADNLLEARKHFSLAVALGSKNSRMIYDYARLNQADGAEPQTTVDLLTKVISLQPDDTDARIFLAEVEASRGRFGSAMLAIAPVHIVKPEQAYRFFSVTAYSHANLRDFAGARSATERALQHANTLAERGQMEQLLQFLDRAEHPDVDRRVNEVTKAQ
jgi:hypothetical protein